MALKKKISHAYNVVVSTLRERRKRKTRSPKWEALERQTVKERGKCAACATTVRLQVHHIKPFHLHPELELDPKNLIVLCMAPNECHLRIGHGGNFKAFNPNVVSDAAIVLANPGMRHEYEARAKAARATTP